MLPSAVSLYSLVLALHIAAVVVGFGSVLAYPLVLGLARRTPSTLPFVHRLQGDLGKRLISPGLGVILLAGIYLASEGHDWGEFWVLWGLGAVLVLGALGGAYFGPREERAAELADRDLGPGGGSLSPEYQALARQVMRGQLAAMTLVLVTVYVMTAKPFS